MTRWRWIVLAAAVACAGGPSAPPPPPAAGLADPQTITASVAGIESVFAQPSLRSYAALWPLFRIPGTAPFGAIGSGNACGPSPALATADPAGTIPDSAASYVFYYDPSTNSYLRSADTTVPAGGVRFLLYRVDAASQPVMPLAGDGYFDLSDDSSGSGPALRARLAGSAGAGAEYTMAPTGRRDNYRVPLAGRVTDGTQVITFADSMTREFVAVTSVATARDSTRAVTYALTATRTTIDLFDNFYDLDLTVTHAADTARVHGSITTYCLVATTALTIMLRGKDYAHVVTGANGPVIVRVDSAALGGDQALAFWSMIRLQGELFTWLEWFFAPARQLLPP